MSKQKIILGCCPHFNEIVNCDFLEDDILTKKLIQYYQDFIFSINEENQAELDLISKLDKAMHKYVMDYRFAKNLKETLEIDAIVKPDFNYLDQLIEYIVNFFREYQEQEVNVKQTRWI